jgi:hypothetical protein
MAETDLSHQPGAKSAVSAFYEVCQKFGEISKGGQAGYVPVYGGQWGLFKYLLRHPVQAYADIFRELIRSQSSLGILVSSFPVETMNAFLARFTESELKALKTLSEIQLRRLKSLITDNPLLKISVPIGSAYALLKVSDELVKVHGSQLDSLRSTFELPVVQSLIGSLLFGFIVGIAALCAQYVFLTVPTIARAQILDDMLQIALEEKRFAPPPVAAAVAPLTSAGQPAEGSSG